MVSKNDYKSRFEIIFRQAKGGGCVFSAAAVSRLFDDANDDTCLLVFPLWFVAVNLYLNCRCHCYLVVDCAETTAEVLGFCSSTRRSTNPEMFRLEFNSEISKRISIITVTNTANALIVMHF